VVSEKQLADGRTQFQETLEQVKAQTKAQDDAAAAATRQIKEFENVQAAHLVIEHVHITGPTGNGEVSFVLANKGNSVARDVRCGISSRSGRISAADVFEDQHGKGSPDPNGFSIGQGEGVPFSQQVTGNWSLAVHVAYVDIFGHAQTFSECYIPHKGTMFLCNGAMARQ
jgi:hypothetical protein